MLPLALIREQPDLVRRAAADKGEPAPIDEILDLDGRSRTLLTEVEALKRRRNEASSMMARADPTQRESMRGELKDLGDRIRGIDQEIAEVQPRLDDLLLRVPNLPHVSVPLGRDEQDNVELARWGDFPTFDFAPKPHWEIGERLGILDFERAVKVAGTRFYATKGLGARLQRALKNWFIDLHVQEHGYTEISTPYLVNDDAMTGTGQLPKFGEDAYHMESDGLWLNPTAEVPVTNLHRDEILPAGSLPIKYVAYCPSWRREAGSAGRDTRGTIRLHQFHKVEMVQLVEPGRSYEALESLLENALDVLRKLNLPYRVLHMCTGDLGFTQAKKYDPEAWFPGQQRYIEISSVSNFESFQARRANIRYRPESGAHAEYVHTLNASGLAIDRAFAAILENYQQADGSVRVPGVLAPYMGGVEVMRATA